MSDSNNTDPSFTSTERNLWCLIQTMNMVSEHAAETRRRQNFLTWGLVAIVLILALHDFLLWSLLCS